MKRLGLIALLLLGSLTASSSATTGAQRVLRLARPTDPKTLDPARVSWTADVALLPFLHIPLLDVVNGTKLTNAGAKTWQVSQDGRTWTFELRPGVKFSNGRPVVAGDYVYAFERILDPRTCSGMAGLLAGIEGAAEFEHACKVESTPSGSGARRHGETPRLAGVQVISPLTLRIRLQQPDISFGYVMAIQSAMPMAREEVERPGAKADTYPVGTGPYQVKEWVRGVRLILEPNPHYGGLERRHFDRIEISIGGDATTQVMMFERGELDIAAIEAPLPIPDYCRLSRDSRWRACFEIAAAPITWFVPLNVQMPPLDNVKVRQAFNFAVNKVRRINAGDGRYRPANGVIPPFMEAFNAKLKGYPYDSERAKQLLAESGVPRPIKVVFWHTPDSDERVVAQGIQSDLRDIGVEVELKAATFNELDESMSRPKTVQMASGGYSSLPDPSDMLRMLFHGRLLSNTRHFNYSFYNNDEVNSLLDQAGTNVIPSQRWALYQKAEEIIVRDAPAIFLGYANTYALKQPWLKGPVIEPIWPRRFDRVWIER